MEFNYSDLKGRIVAKYGNQAKFASALDWDAAKLSVKLTKTGFRREEIIRIADLLDITPEQIGKYFFTVKVQKVEQEA